jgi:hypothetical protein
VWRLPWLAILVAPPLATRLCKVGERAPKGTTRVRGDRARWGSMIYRTSPWNDEEGFGGGEKEEDSMPP